jgi:hypothetical protein
MCKEIVDVWLRRLSSIFLIEKNPLNRLGGFFHAVIYGMKEWQQSVYERLSSKITFHKLS